MDLAFLVYMSLAPDSCPDVLHVCEIVECLAELHPTHPIHLQADTYFNVFLKYVAAACTGSDNKPVAACISFGVHRQDVTYCRKVRVGTSLGHTRCYLAIHCFHFVAMA